MQYAHNYIYVIIITIVRHRNCHAQLANIGTYNHGVPSESVCFQNLQIFQANWPKSACKFRISTIIIYIIFNSQSRYPNKLSLYLYVIECNTYTDR